MKIRKFWKYFLFLFLISFFIINWSDVSWIFNYRAVSGVVSNVIEDKDNGIENDFVEDKVVLNYEEEHNKEDIIEIPKINISVPLITVKKSSTNEEVFKALDRGAVIFPSSVAPGESGQTTVLGHSSPLGWPKVKYDWIFSSLNELVKGDEIFIQFNNKKFFYIVSEKIFLEKGEEIPDSLTNSENVLLLISCWPPGKDIRRIAIIAKLTSDN
ncbi:MAG: sortase [Candidatus Paceibacterota bacterium]